MRTNKIAILGAVMSSLMILTTAFQLSTHSTYSIASTRQPEPVLSTEISYDDLSKRDRKEIECLAKNIYFEAAAEPRSGWAAVASVTMNRLMTGNYAKTVCGVVYQKTGSTYQFSWVGMKNRLSKINQEVYNEIVEFATPMYLNYDSSKDVTKGATYYHADYVNPGWRLQRVKKIGRHIFYRSKTDYAQLGA